VNLADRQDLYNGFGDALARAVELAVTPAIFGFFGWLLDGKVGTRPLFTIVFTVFVFGYVFWKMWGGYERQMRSHEKRMGLRNDD
jgi:F0F1-type ATP synthase assembly protein I